METEAGQTAIVGGQKNFYDIMHFSPIKVGPKKSSVDARQSSYSDRAWHLGRFLQYDTIYIYP